MFRHSRLDELTSSCGEHSKGTKTNSKGQCGGNDEGRTTDKTRSAAAPPRLSLSFSRRRIRDTNGARPRCSAPHTQQQLPLNQRTHSVGGRAHTQRQDAPIATANTKRRQPFSLFARSSPPPPQKNTTRASSSSLLVPFPPARSPRSCLQATPRHHSTHLNLSAYQRSSTKAKHRPASKWRQRHHQRPAALAATPTTFRASTTWSPAAPARQSCGA